MTLNTDDAHTLEQLPLRPVVFAILLVLRAGPLHGYGVMQRVNKHLGKRALLGAGTLYRTLKEMREATLIEPAPTPPARANAPDSDKRRHYYRLSDQGDRLVAAEARRLGLLMRAADLGDALDLADNVEAT